jgi:hypothetical protein
MKSYLVIHDGIGGRYVKGDTPTDGDLREWLATRHRCTDPAAQQRIIDELLAGGAIEPVTLPRTPATGRKATRTPAARKAR